jgi:hypothetical protein
VGLDLAVLDRRSLIPAFFRDFEVRKDSRVDDVGFGIVLRACRPGHPRFAVLPAFFRDFEIPEDSGIDDVGFGSCLFGCAWVNLSSRRFWFSSLPRVEVLLASLVVAESYRMI